MKGAAGQAAAGPLDMYTPGTSSQGKAESGEYWPAQQPGGKWSAWCGAVRRATPWDLEVSTPRRLATALQEEVAGRERARSAGIVSHKSSSKHNHRKTWLCLRSDEVSPLGWWGKPHVAGPSGTGVMGQDKGKEVPRGGYGSEAQWCGFEDMDLDYIEDSTEEEEIVERV
ncbi:hypothetical protein NDU88_006027 [Pleurodeles waltl]|uniref:Uncharacterized protein n=1 Tax=Pleurodeles waltl TaxID=8319 RepID=A0AAV7X0F7_PLEWA|nr:hypothetical protein NDU88_006027 [Pleurodeles waltl]